MIKGKGSVADALTDDAVRNIIAKTFDTVGVNGKKVLILLPDSTRTCPLPLMFDAISSYLKGKVSKLDYLIALGTHQPMPEKDIDKLIGATRTERDKKYGRINIYNHLWEKPETFKKLGKINAEEIEKETQGLFKQDVNIDVNRMIFDYDHVFICGPVFPHEVVGFSGGYKYLFPGIGGKEFINFFHWLGAVITNPKVIGNKNTPMRRLINRAAQFIDIPIHALCMVVHHEKLFGLYGGTPIETWSEAADLSNKLHITYIEKPFKKILSCAPAMYDDIWTAGKCMYKVEPIVADGGELIIYAPHITEISYTHGKVIDQIGYHVRDYFLKEWHKFKKFPWGVIAHSTHVRGIGTYENGIEQGRINVILATSIPQERCAKINLGYLDPNTINKTDWAGKESEGILMIPKAGETLYKLKNPPEWQKA
jgi:nickel-dependent lactate racemase